MLQQTFRNAGRLACAVALLPLAAGCVPHLGDKPQPLSAANLASARSLPTENGAWPGDGWWTAYGDPQLDGLIAEGLVGSPDIAAAAARLAHAQGVAQTAGADLLPELGADADVGKTKQSYNNGFPKEFLPKGWKNTGTLNLQLSWDLDLFGRQRALRRAALDETQAARVEAAEARLVLAASIAAAYADLARLYLERDVAVQSTTIQQDAARLVAQRVQNGLDTEAERRQALAAIPTAQVDVTAIDESIAVTRNQIAALIGAGPDRGLAIARPALTGIRPLALPADAGIDLVGRRPDVTAARARVEAAAERIHAARAAFYPDLRLSALVGVQSLGLSNLLEKGSTYGSAGPALSLPLFDAGRRQGDYRVTRGDYDAAVADYNRLLVGALQDVANAVAARRSVAIQAQQAQAALADSEQAYRVATLRYQGGLSTYLNVLSADQTVISARRRVADITARAFAVDVALIRALGGGFAPQQEPAHG